MAGSGYNDNLGSLAACGNDEWCCQVDVEDGKCNCYEGVGVFSLAPGQAQTIIGIQDLSLTSTNFLPSSSPPLISSSAAATLPLQQTHTTSLATKSSRRSSTRATDASASSSDPLTSAPRSTTTQRSTSSEQHASTLHTTLEQSKSSRSGSASTRTAQATPALTSTDTPTDTSAPSSSPTNSNVTTAASPSYLSTHKTGVGVGTTFGAIAAVALILGIFCCRRRKNQEKNPPIKARVYRRSVSPSQILGPPNPDYSTVPPLTTPYTRQSNADINNAVQPVSTTARASRSGHLDLPPTPHPYQRYNNNSSSLASSNVSNPAFRGYPSVPPSSTQSSVPLLNTNNPGASQAGYYGEAPSPHPYSPQEALRDQSTPLIPPTRSPRPTVGLSANQPHTIFHTAADSLAQGIGTPPPRYSPRRPNRSVPAWSPDSVGTGNSQRLQ